MMRRQGSAQVTASAVPGAPKLAKSVPEGPQAEWSSVLNEIWYQAPKKLSSARRNKVEVPGLWPLGFRPVGPAHISPGRTSPGSKALTPPTAPLALGRERGWGSGKSSLTHGCEAVKNRPTLSF
jgi:hypothetical protein